MLCKFQFRGSSFLVPFIPDNEYAGGSAVCIHKELLPEETIVTHLITCQGSVRVVYIQSGRHNLVLVNAHSESELSLRQFRGKCISFTRTGHTPMMCAFLGDIVTQKKDDSCLDSPMVICHVLEIAQSDFSTKDSSALGIIRTLSRIDRIFPNPPMSEGDFHCFHVFENLVNRTIPRDHAAVRLVVQKPSN